MRCTSEFACSKRSAAQSCSIFSLSLSTPYYCLFLEEKLQPPAFVEELTVQKARPGEKVGYTPR